MRKFIAGFLDPQQHRNALAEWISDQGVSWIYVAKVLLAMALAYWLSMFLALPSTRSAPLTVLIVMQPQAGQVFTKSLARLIGTAFGLTASLTLVTIFHQHPTMFMLATALWCMICVTGAVRYRDFRSYGFLLAGYTVGLIGLPGAIHPDAAVSSAVGRALAVVLGIISGGLVSALVFPDTSEAAYKTLLARRLTNFCQMSLGLFKHTSSEQHYQLERLKFATQAVMTESVRQAACIENPLISAMKSSLIQLTHNFMALGTRLNAISRLYFYLKHPIPGGNLVKIAIDAINTPLVELLEEIQTSSIASQQIGRFRHQMNFIILTLKQNIREQRQLLLHHPDYQALGANEQQRLMELYETFVELLFRFTSSFSDYLRDYAKLARPETFTQHHEPSTRWSWEPSINLLHSLSCGLRAGVVMLIIYGLWYISGWTSGTMAVQLAIIVLMLSATSPAPHRMTKLLAQGAGIGYILGFIITFFLLPNVNGFPLMFFCLSPIIVVSTWLTLNPKYAGLGFGAINSFCFVASPTNPATFNPVGFMNSSLAGFIGMMIAASVLTMMFPPSGRWLSRSMIRDLRMLVPMSATAPIKDLAAKVDSRCRDLMHQTYSLTTGQPMIQTELLSWYTSVTAISHALIELRELQEKLTQHSQPITLREYCWFRQLDQLTHSLEQLYRAPNQQSCQQTLRLTKQVIALTKALLESENQLFDESPKRQMLSYLHFIQAALLNRQGPLRDYLQEQDTVYLLTPVAN